MEKTELEKYEHKIAFGDWVKWSAIALTAMYFPEWINRRADQLYSTPAPYNFQTYINTLIYDAIIPTVCNSLYLIGCSMRNKGLIGKIEEELKEKYELKERPKRRNYW